MISDVQNVFTETMAPVRQLSPPQLSAPKPNFVPETGSLTVRISGKYFIASGSIVKSFETLLIM